MFDFDERIQRLETYLDRANKKLTHLEEVAKGAGGPVSNSFAERMADASSERDRLREHIRRLRLEDEFSLPSSGARIDALHVCDEIGSRLEKLFVRLEKHNK